MAKAAPTKSAKKPAAKSAASPRLATKRADLKKSADPAGFVKPRPDKPTNPRMAAAMRAQHLVETVESKAQSGLANPKAAKIRKAREAKELAKQAALENRLPRHAYIPAYADEICERLAEGEDVSTILKSLNISFVTMCDWMRKVPLFAAAFATARENQTHLFISQIVTIADNVVPGQVDIAKLQIDTRKFLASKLLAKLYGDKVQVSGDAENPLTTKLVMSADDLLKRIKGG